MIEIFYKFTFLNQYINLERGNRYQAAKVKRNTTSAIRFMLLGKPKIPTPCGLSFHWIIPSKRLDLDNCAFASKYCLDGMVSAGIIPSDNVNHITELRHTFEIGKKTGVQIEIIKKGG